MTTILLLLMTLAQCGPAGCSRPQPILPTPTRPAYVAVPAWTPLGPDWGWHWATYDGRVIPLWGYHSDPQTVVFDPKLPANAVMIAYSRTIN
jgi:hypothetical protein